jgi:hypothetical protein
VTTPWEDHLLERKTDRDLRDIRRTAVAFANSVRPDHTAVIEVGESNDGTVTGLANPDVQQRKIREEMEKIYPPIVWRQQLYEKDGKTCIRIQIEYSGETPHFADAAWIRKGSETVGASDEILQKLIELRSSKVRELMKWFGKEVTVSWSMADHGIIGPNWSAFPCEIVEVTEYFSTFNSKQGPRAPQSEPNAWLTLSWDDRNARPQIYVDPRMKGRPPW